MRLVRDARHVPESLHSGVVALGNFEGAHRGHQAVIAAAREIAHETGTPLLVLTFTPHPREFFHPHLAPLRIYPLSKKIKFLRQLGVNALVLQRFNAAFAQLTPHEFIDGILVRALNAHHIVTGESFVFGKGREGNAAVLTEAAADGRFGYTRVPTWKDAEGQACSTTRIRAYLDSGDIAAASILLGRPYRIEGRVVHGEKRGRALGFPTANIRLAHIYAPKRGVYAVKAHIGGKTLGGVANLGLRPTFGGVNPLLEVHCFDVADNFYGQRMTVEPVAYLREERAFDGIEALTAQIALDSARAREILRTCS